jgi:predicted transcriptional regulator
MHTYVKTLAQIASRYAPSRMLSFELVHIFKVFQLLNKNKHVSRALLCQELLLGEGSVRTLLRHLKMQGLIHSTNQGTVLTEKGKMFSASLVQSIPTESEMSQCSIALGKFNYAVLLKQASFAIKSGLEQRDASIKVGALGATTLLYKDYKFIMPGTISSPLDRNDDFMEKKEGNSNTAKFLIEKLHPKDNDVVIIGSDNNNLLTAEFGAKNAALFTIMNHEKHTH